MDAFYNMGQAAEELEAVIVKREGGSPSLYSLKPDVLLGGEYTIEPQDNRSFIFATGTNPAELSEATFSIQGVICGSVLPPFPKKTSTSEQRLRGIRQGLTLTGLGSAAFSESVENLRYAHSMFKRFTPGNGLEDTIDFLTTYSNDGTEYPAVSAHNRLFTPVQYAEGLERIPITKDVDPDNIFGKVDPKELVHTEDNQVTYHIINSSAEGEWLCTDTKPVVFHIGDLVEIVVSLVCFPVKDIYKVKLVLRSVALINGQFTTNAFMARASATIEVKEVGPKRLKRRQAYGRSASQSGEKKTKKGEGEDRGKEVEAMEEDTA